MTFKDTIDNFSCLKSKTVFSIDVANKAVVNMNFLIICQALKNSKEIKINSKMFKQIN